MKNDAIREAVRDRYGRIAEGAEEGCCGPSCCGGDEKTSHDTSGETSQSTAIGYDDEQLGRIPEGADLGLGSGNPVAHADLQKGETVLDLGSGGGIDSFLASERVGPTGKVIGVDMTPEMVTRARANAREGGYTNVDFRLGEIESLPVADATVDVIISNCVLNLSPERDRVLAESLRVLKPGGRLVISDLVCDVPIPATLREEAEAVTACLPVEREDYASQLRTAGFVDVTISDGQRYPREALTSTPIGKKIAAEEPELMDSLDEFADSVRGVIIEGRRA
jgi:SAM-dependent methyltransferase